MLQTNWALLRIFWLTFFGLMTNVCLAQELPLDLAYSFGKKRSSSQNSTLSTETPSETPLRNPPKSTNIDTSLLDSVRLNLNEVRCPNYDYWDDYASRPSYNIQTEYVGFHRAVYNQLDRLAMRYYKQQMRTYWEQSYKHPLDLDRQMRDYNLYISDFHNQWWNRSWWDSLPPEKGGQVTIVHRVGCQTDVLQLGPIRLSNEGKVSWESWKVDVEDNQDVVLTDAEAIQQGAITQKYNVGLRSPEAGIDDDWYQIRFAAKVNLRVDNFSEENKTEIGCNFKFTLLNKNRTPTLRFQASVRYQPLTGRAEAQFQLSLLEF